LAQWLRRGAVYTWVMLAWVMLISTAGGILAVATHERVWDFYHIVEMSWLVIVVGLCLGIIIKHPLSPSHPRGVIIPDALESEEVAMLMEAIRGQSYAAELPRWAVAMAAHAILQERILPQDSPRHPSVGLLVVALTLRSQLPHVLSGQDSPPPTVEEWLTRLRALVQMVLAAWG